MAERLSIEIQFDILKVDESLVFAWGMICSKDGEPYPDLDREHFTTHGMLKAVTEFGANAVRPTDEMYDGEPDGIVVHSFPMTDEIAKAYRSSETYRISPHCRQPKLRVSMKELAVWAHTHTVVPKSFTPSPREGVAR